MTTYTRTSFETFVLTYLWRTGDTELAAALPGLIRMAESGLNRVLRTQKQIYEYTAPVLDWEISLPSDYLETISITVDELGAFEYVTPQRMADLRVAVEAGTSSGYANYSITDKLQLGYEYDGAGEETITWWMYVKPHYWDAEDSEVEGWFMEDHFDLYLYAVLLQTAPFLRDDSRVATWQAMYDRLLGELVSRDAVSVRSGSPLRMKFPNRVA